MSSHQNRMVQEEKNSIEHLLRKYPHGLTAPEIMKGVGIGDDVKYGNRMKYLVSRGQVKALDAYRSDHKNRYVLADLYPYETPVDLWLKEGGKVSPSKDDVYRTVDILRYIERHPEGVYMQDIRDGLGLDTEGRDSIYYAICRFEGNLIECINPDETFRKDRVYRIRGSEDPRCIERYKEGRPLTILYGEYVRNTLELSDKGTIDYEDWRGLRALVKDIDATKDHTPKDNNLKITFNKDGKRLFILALTNEAYYTVRDGKREDISVEEVYRIIDNMKGERNEKI